MTYGKQVWGLDAAGPSGYTKHIAIFDAGDHFKIVIKPAMAAPDIVIDLDGYSALALSACLRDGVLSP